jgi:large subunit ribosomal protein L23
VKKVKSDKVKPNVAKPGKVATDKKGKSDVIKGKTAQAYKVLVKPLVTEKASDLGVLNKYVFAIAVGMNKIEVKKAIRTIYKVEPVKINIANFKGKNVRYGRVKGKTKSWKKAVVTLKPGDKIEVYEGV